MGATPRQLSLRQGSNLAKVRRYGARLGLVMDNGVMEGSCPSLALGAESCIAEPGPASNDVSG